MKILMVCLGNICRSPLAEGIMRKKMVENFIAGEVDSCGFESFHIGNTPDQRAIQVAHQHGIDISDHRGKIFMKSYFDTFDKIFVMDANNFRDVANVARNSDDMEKVDYIMNMVFPDSNKAVPDPYYGSQADFTETYNLLDAATDKIIEAIKMEK